MGDKPINKGSPADDRDYLALCTEYILPYFREAKVKRQTGGPSRVLHDLQAFLEKLAESLGYIQWHFRMGYYRI